MLWRALIVLLFFLICVIWEHKLSPVFAPGHSLSVKQILLDAGHGGEDGGALSVSGVKESQINLQIVKRMEQVFAFLGTVPILTREEDCSIHDSEAVTLREKKVSDLKKRVAIFQEHSGVTAISVHQNTYPEGKYRGCQVFYAPTEGSKELAETVQSEVKTYLQPDNARSAKQVPDTVYLMNHIENLAILVECGFLTNPEEEQLLQTDSYQKQFAIVVCSALTKGPN